MVNRESQKGFLSWGPASVGDDGLAYWGALACKLLFFHSGRQLKVDYNYLMIKNHAF
jgi:hypothetical protein